MSKPDEITLWATVNSAYLCKKALYLEEPRCLEVPGEGVLYRCGSGMYEEGFAVLEDEEDEDDSDVASRDALARLLFDGLEHGHKRPVTLKVKRGKAVKG